MNARRAYNFDPAIMAEVCAHRGNGLIQTVRVEERPAQGAANFIDLTILPCGTSIGIHTHSLDNEEIYVIVSGHGTMTLENQKLIVGPGDVIVNSRGGTHGLVNTGDQEMKLVVIEIPTGE